MPQKLICGTMLTGKIIMGLATWIQTGFSSGPHLTKSKKQWHCVNIFNWANILNTYIHILYLHSYITTYLHNYIYSAGSLASPSVGLKPGVLAERGLIVYNDRGAL